MFNFALTVTFLLGQILPLHTLYSGKKAKSLHWETCNHGDTLENKCNKCVCDYEGIYECEPKKCTDREVHYSKAAECHPHRLYYQGSTSCICTPKGLWPHASCREIFDQLPKESIKKRTCEPQGYVRVDCNVCRCNDKGQVDTTRCTANTCKKRKPKSRKSDGDATEKVFTTCEITSWYSMSPCQFCYCHDTHKLICSTRIDKQSNTPMGKYHLSLCGQGLLKELAALKSGVGEKQILRSDKTIDAKYGYENVPLERQSEGQYERDMQEEQNYEQNNENDGNPHEANMDLQDESNESQKNGKNLNEIRIHLTSSLDGDEDPSKTININPMDVIKQIIQFRKSLTLDPTAQCVPGTTISVKCNRCHCLKNGKLLCTNKKCN